MNRHLRNTFSAISATAVMLVATLIVAVPAQPLAEQPVAQPAEKNSTFVAAPAPRRQFDVQAVQAQADDIGARAEHLAAQLEKTETAGETIAHVAAFTAEVATVTAMTAVLEELPEAVQTTHIVEPAQAPRVHKHKRSRQSLAMPYFSFASRS